MNSCYNCGEKGHLNWNYPKKGPTCFNYNKPGHLLRDCPKLRQTGKPQALVENPRVQQGRVFNLTG